VADLQRSLTHDHALDQQLQDLLPLRQGRPVQTGPDLLAERRQVHQHRPGARCLVAKLRLPFSLLGQGRPTLDDSSAAEPEFLQVDDLGLVGVDQPPLLTLQPLELGLQLLGVGPLARVPLGVGAGHVPELGQQRLWVSQQALDVAPDRDLKGLRLGHSLRAPRLAGAGGAVLAAAPVIPPRWPPALDPLSHPEHPQATSPARQQASQQI
jgi:hypothetical protein